VAVLVILSGPFREQLSGNEIADRHHGGNETKETLTMK
jgi:hypothetical protein